MLKFSKLALLLFLCFSSIATLAQEACPAIVLDALAQMENACVDIGRNQACYGNGSILALDPDGTELEDFAQAGDVAEVSAISSMSLSGMNEDEGLWGLAVLSVQADIPNTLPGQNVTMLLFGESELSAVEGDGSAFVFSAGIGQLTCNEAPNGLLIQTPEGEAEIHLTINNIVIGLGSTAFITAEADGEFSFALLEGHAILNSEASEIRVNAGEFSTISLDEDLNPTGEFSEVLPIEGNLELPQLPLELLPREVSPAEATAATGEIITPRAGNWRFETVSFDATAECPAMVVTLIEAGMAEQSTLFTNFGGEGWDFETFYKEATLESTGFEAPEGEYSSPEPNVYVFETEGNAEAGPFIFTFVVVSETEVHGGYFLDSTQFIAGCTMTTDFIATWGE